jgi:hypothetical protein
MRALSALILTSLSANDQRKLLEVRLRRMDRRRAILALLFLGVAALIVGLYLAQGGGTTRVVVIALAIAGCFVVYGLFLAWQIATGGARRQRFFQLLDRDPGRIARIYGAKVVRAGRTAVVRPLTQPEAQSVGDWRSVVLVVELEEPSRTRRLLGLNKLAARVSAPELIELLAYLRGIAPQAQGPPG